MSDTYKQLTNAEKESAIRMGIVPTSGNQNTIFSVLTNVLETGFDWRREGGTLHIQHPSGSIQIQGLQCEFQWD